MIKKKLTKKNIIIAICIFFSIAILFPFIKPLRIEGYFIPYNYTVHGTYVEINKYTGGEFEVEIPAYIWFKPVKKISSGAFKEVYYLSSVKIPNTVTSLWNTFEYCINLENVEIGKNVREIAIGTFGGCWNLKEIVIPENVEKLTGITFNACESLESVIFYNPSVEISNDAFEYCNFDILTLKSVEGSTVEKYAKEHGINWEVLESVEEK